MRQDKAATATLETSPGGEEFRILVERHSRIIFRLAYRMTANEQDAEDIVQETFMRAYRWLPQFENRANFGTWLYRIGVNCALDYIRMRERHNVASEWIERVSGSCDYAIRATDPSPDRVLMSHEVQKRITEALTQLTPKERVAFILRHFEGYPIEEVAQILDVRANAAKHTVFRAVKKLRKFLMPLAGAIR